MYQRSEAFVKIKKKMWGGVGSGGGGRFGGGGGRVGGVSVDVNEELNFCENSKKKKSGGGLGRGLGWGSGWGSG